MYRGFIQSADGVIREVGRVGKKRIRFTASFGLSDAFIEKVKYDTENVVFSERSRIARLGIQMISEHPGFDKISGKHMILNCEAEQTIAGYPEMKEMEGFFTKGLPVGRLVYCDPNALLNSDSVLQAINEAKLKLPESLSISSSGSIVIGSHKMICILREPLTKKQLSRILFQKDGREILNRHQKRKKVDAVIIPPEAGVITTCSMYLHDHYVVLQSNSDLPDLLGSHFPATVLDPIKTRGIRIYLEIFNRSNQPIVNPRISARIYKTPEARKKWYVKDKAQEAISPSVSQLKQIRECFESLPLHQCHYAQRAIAVVQPGEKEFHILVNGPEIPCNMTEALCARERDNFSRTSKCPHIYATSQIRKIATGKRVNLILHYFPNLIEHHEIVDLATEGLLQNICFFHPSVEHGPFLSQEDHSRLLEYHCLGIETYWFSEIIPELLIHTYRDGKGYFVRPTLLHSFHKTMLFAFYGSNINLKQKGEDRLGELMDAMIQFWGKNIGIVTGGGSGVMEVANRLARNRGILSGANYLDITDQPITPDVDFCQIFQDSCRHSRQKWFEIASFPIFNIGGIGSMEELGITLCNMKLSILEPVPVVMFDTEGDGSYWSGIQKQLQDMVSFGKAPGWILDNLVITNDPQEVTKAFREKLHLF